MRSVNKVELIGNLGNDPELRYTAAGQPVTNFRVATNERFKSKSGDSQERTEWHRITVWGKAAESCAEYLSKGSQVRVEGTLRTRSWKDRDGATRYTTEIHTGNVIFLSGGKRQKVVEGEDVSAGEVTSEEQELTAGLGSDEDLF